MYNLIYYSVNPWIELKSTYLGDWTNILLTFWE